MAEAIKFILEQMGTSSRPQTPHATVSVNLFLLNNKNCGYSTNKCKVDRPQISVAFN
jgi:hypothetical protein